ncbi:uncharacterized protein BX663DRAFT_585894 [Cokeromyces recurvatus]|uniref:uncharacterized protein n=1 Tax=Cokeromyces recurvatus TaxID=90255 RepID=UPI00222011EA|nr:uncharacterized protein BX663DRAFT_585894 [Cokeromyces recurvatus]KAI7897455.1 hypothetical protein BX663DRAFT_585894 [Cokeromyces recurvatus]
MSSNAGFQSLFFHFDNEAGNLTFAPMDGLINDIVEEQQHIRVVDDSLSINTVMEWETSHPAGEPNNNSTMQLLTFMEYRNIISESEMSQESEVPLAETPSVAPSTSVTPVRSKRGAYHKYTEKQVLDIFHLVFECGMTAKTASEKTGIVIRTGQSYIRQERLRRAAEYELPSDVSGQAIEEKPVKTGNKKLFDDHSKFLVQLYEKNPAATLAQAREALCKEFEGLTITLSGLQKHLMKKFVVKGSPAVNYQ